MTQFLISDSVVFAVAALLLMGIVSWIYIVALAMQKYITRIENLKTTECALFWSALLGELQNKFDDNAEYSGHYVKHLIQGMIIKMRSHNHVRNRRTAEL